MPSLLVNLHATSHEILNVSLIQTVTVAPWWGSWDSGSWRHGQCCIAVGWESGLRPWVPSVWSASGASIAFHSQSQWSPEPLFHPIPLTRKQMCRKRMLSTQVLKHRCQPGRFNTKNFIKNCKKKKKNQKPLIPMAPASPDWIFSMLPSFERSHNKNSV